VLGQPLTHRGRAMHPQPIEDQEHLALTADRM
jgi:hypothetical protein